MRAEVALLYCVRCRILYPTLRPLSAPSMADWNPGETANLCPGCNSHLVFGGVHMADPDVPIQKIFQDLSAHVDEMVARLVAAGADRLPMSRAALDTPRGIVAWGDEKETEEWAGIGIAWKDA